MEKIISSIGILRWCFKVFSAMLSSVVQSCPTVCDPMDYSMPGFPVHHQLPQLTQTHAHQVGVAIQASHCLSSPSPPSFGLSQHQGLFKWVSSLHQVAKVLDLQLEHQSFQWIFRIDVLWDLLIWSPCCPRDTQDSRVFFSSGHTLILSSSFLNMSAETNIIF